MGRVDVDNMLAEMTWPQFREWMTFYQVDPWGSARGDLQAAIISSTMANAWRGKGRVYKVKDFIPEFGKRKRRQTQAEISNILTMAALTAKAAKANKKARA